MKTADVVLVMEVSQLVVVRRRFHGAREKTFLLSSLAPDVALEIRDPVGKDEAALAYLEAIRVRPDAKQAHVNLGIVWQESGDLRPS